MDRKPSKLERLCYEREARDMIEGPKRGLRFDPEAGERVVKFIEGFCRHYKGKDWAGKPLILDDWQKRTVRQVFGWMREDGSRRFRTAYVEIPRKNGKSTFAAPIGLYLTIADGEPGAEVYSSATKKDQARIVWGSAEQMVKMSPALKKHVKMYRSNLNVPRTASKFEPLGADSNTLDGLNPHGNIVDELHAHKDRGVWDVLDTAMGARHQPLTLAITTAGTYDPESIGWQMHDYAVKVLEGVIEDDTFYAFIATVDEPPKTKKGEKPDEDYYFRPEIQAMANPGYGKSVKVDYLAQQAKKAKLQAGFLNEYLRLHLNVWTQQVTRWLSLEDWAMCDPTADGTLECAQAREEELVGRACLGGLDLSSKLDLSSFVALFEDDSDDQLVHVVPRFWMPERTIELKAKKGQKHYAQWVREGWLIATPGEVVDYEFIRKEVNDFSKRFVLREVAFDPWGATDLSTRLQGDGQVMVETRQGYKTLSEPSKDLEARIVAKKVRHGGNPVLRFCVANAVVSKDAAGNIKPDKEKASDKIDGVVAMIMALSRIICQTESENPYEDRGFLSL